MKRFLFLLVLFSGCSFHQPVDVDEKNFPEEEFEEEFDIFEMEPTPFDTPIPLKEEDIPLKKATPWREEPPKGDVPKEGKKEQRGRLNIRYLC